ncbi:MAG TPA: antibiotic biosynthesis monooxygenase [Candidatus Acidoferrales bacterium]|nr:antibiotic biosynthesis monooxygenase [Candidatus Acidoferrales bacterium]
MVFARMSTWTFKKTKAEEGFLELDNQLNSLTRQTAGFRGYMSLLPHEDANSAVILSLWQDEETLKASEKGAFVELTKMVQPYLEKPPTSKSFRVFSTELFQRQEKPDLKPTKTLPRGRI